MDIQDFRIFLRLAALQSLSQVGTELGLTPGTISKRLQAMEDELGVKLFDRTTRSIRITEEGEHFQGHVCRIVDEFEVARAMIGESVTQPKGRVKVSAPASFNEAIVAPAFCRFMRLYPDIELAVDLTDRLVNLQDEGYDLALRIGVLPDSALKARRLAADQQVVVAAPALIEEVGTPAKPEDLGRMPCLVRGEACQWSFWQGGEERTVRVAGRLRSNSGEFLRLAALDGQGLLRTSHARVAGDIQRGRLVHVLPEYELGTDSAIWAVYPSSKHILPKLRVLLDFLAEWFKSPAATGDSVEKLPRTGAHAVRIVAGPEIRPRSAAG